MTIHSEPVQYLRGHVTCDQCGVSRKFDEFEEFEDAYEICTEFNASGWFMPNSDDENQADLCPGCAKRSALDPDSIAKRAARRAADARELNGRPLCSYAELGMSEAVL